MNAGSSASYLACTPYVPVLCNLFNRDGNRRAFKLPGEGGDHFHCAVEPSPGHIRCRSLEGHKRSVLYVQCLLVSGLSCKSFCESLQSLACNHAGTNLKVAVLTPFLTFYSGHDAHKTRSFVFSEFHKLYLHWQLQSSSFHKGG